MPSGGLHITELQRLQDVPTSFAQGTAHDGDYPAWDTATGKFVQQTPTWDQGSGYVTPHHAGDGIHVTGASLFGTATANRLVWGGAQVTYNGQDPTYDAGLYGTASVDLLRQVVSTATASYNDYFAGFRGEVQVSLPDSDPGYGRFTGVQGITRELVTPNTAGTYYREYYGVTGHVFLTSSDGKADAFGLRGDAYLPAGTYTAAKQVYGLMATAKIQPGVAGGATVGMTGLNVVVGTYNSDFTSAGGTDMSVGISTAFGYTPPKTINALYGYWTTLRNTGYKVGGLWGQRLTYVPGGVNDHGGYNDAPDLHAFVNVPIHAGVFLEGWYQGKAISSDGGEVDLSTGAATNRGLILRGAVGQSVDLVQLWSDPATNVLYGRIGADGGAHFGPDLSSVFSPDTYCSVTRTTTTTVGADTTRTYAAGSDLYYYNPPNTTDPGLGVRYGRSGVFIGSAGDLNGVANGGGINGQARGYSRQGSAALYGGDFFSTWVPDQQTGNALLFGVQGRAFSSPTAYTSGGTFGQAIGGLFIGQNFVGAAGILAGVQAQGIVSSGIIGTGVYGVRASVLNLGGTTPEAVGLRSSLTDAGGNATNVYGLKLLGWGRAGGYAINSNGGQVYFSTGNSANYGVTVQGVVSQTAPLFQAWNNLGAMNWCVYMDGTASAQGLQTAPGFVRTLQSLTPDGSNQIATNAARGSGWTVTLVGNSTLLNPTGGVDGQDVLWRIVQDATGGRTLTLGSAFHLGPQAAFAIDLGAHQVSYLRAFYYASSGKWHVTGAVPNQTTGGFN